MPHAAFSPPKNKNSNNMENKILVAITQGDTNGIGYEIILKAFANSELFDICTPIIYGSDKVLQQHRKILGINTPFKVINKAESAREGQLNLVNVIGENIEPPVTFGQTTDNAGRLAFLALEAATRDAINGVVDVIVTCPINLAAMPKGDFPFTSQNEYLGKRLSGSPLMLLCNPFMRVALATNHLPLSEVKEAITPELLEERIRQCYQSMSRDFLSAQPRVAVLGLNPHAGSHGMIGTEEADVLQPVIIRLADEGIRVYGPYAADGFFGAGLYKHFDCVISLFHDQGVTPFKALSMDEGVNFTAGLSVVCTSPDHGPAYDKAGKGEASELSFLHAIYTAVDIFRHRALYDESHANPLPHVPHHDRREDRRRHEEQ